MARPVGGFTSARGSRRGEVPRSGGTFIELVLAIFVFVLAGTGIVGSFLSAHQLSDHAQNTAIAIEDLRDMMERIHATPFANLLTQFPAGVPDGGAGTPYTTIVGGYSLGSEQITVTYPTQTPDAVEVVVTVNWIQAGWSRSTSLSSWRTSS